MGVGIHQRDHQHKQEGKYQNESYRIYGAEQQQYFCENKETVEASHDTVS